MKRLVLGLVVLAVLLSAVALILALHRPAPVIQISTTGSASPAPSPLIYLCSHQPCRYEQELTVSDPHRKPIFSVSEAGPVGAYGACLADYPRGKPPRDLYPAVVICYQPPGPYDRANGQPDVCVAPARWIAPQGTWLCRRGRWVSGG